MVVTDFQKHTNTKLSKIRKILEQITKRLKILIEASGEDRNEAFF